MATRKSEGLVLAGNMRQKLDGIAIKMGDEKFDIWHEAVQTKGREGAVQVVQAEASNEEMPHKTEP